METQANRVVAESLYHSLVDRFGTGMGHVTIQVLVLFYGCKGKKAKGLEMCKGTIR